MANLALVTILSVRSRGSNYLYVVDQPPRPPLHPTQTPPGAAGCTRCYLAGADPQALTVARRVRVLPRLRPGSSLPATQSIWDAGLLVAAAKGQVGLAAFSSLNTGKEQLPGSSAQREELGWALRPPPEMPTHDLAFPFQISVLSITS